MLSGNAAAWALVTGYSFSMMDSQDGEEVWAEIRDDDDSSGSSRIKNKDDILRNILVIDDIFQKLFDIIFFFVGVEFSKIMGHCL